MAFLTSLMDFLKKRGYLLMSIFLTIQAILSITFAIIYLSLEFEEFNSTRIKIFVILILSLFLGFMIYFAYHSVNK